MIFSKIFRILFILATLIPFSYNLSAQIKKDIQRQQQQKQYEQQRKANEMKEKSRISKAQLTLQELQQLADLKDAIEVDKILTAKGWKMYKTETESDIETITYTFDKEKYSDRALYWAYWGRDRTNSDKILISWRFSDDDIFHQLEKSLTTHKYVKQSSQVRESDDAGIQTVYRNNTYEVQIVKKPKETYGGNPVYSVTCRNHKRETEKLEKEIAKIKKTAFSVNELMSIIKTPHKNEVEQIINTKGFVYNHKWVPIRLPGDSSVFNTILFTDKVTLFSAEFPEDGTNHYYDGLWDLYLCNSPKAPIVFFFDDTLSENIIIFHGWQGVQFEEMRKNIQNSDFILMRSDTAHIRWWPGASCAEIYQSESDSYIEYTEVYQYQDYRIILGYDDLAEYPCSDSDCSSYTLLLYNLSQSDEREAEYERKMREQAERERLEREKERKYIRMINSAEQSYADGDLNGAILSLKNAISIAPEKEKELSGRIDNLEKEIRINSLVYTADSLCQSEQFELAKQFYNDALSISLNPKREIILDKIATTDTIVTILSERTKRWYNYESLQVADCKAKSTFLTNGIKKYLFQLDDNLPPTTLNFLYEIDTLNHTSYNLTHSVKADMALLKFAKGMAEGVQLLPCNLRGYPVNAQASFVFDFSYKHADITVKKKPAGTFSKHKDFSLYRSDIDKLMGASAPYAKYSFSFSQVQINEQEFSDNRMTKMKVIGGPANAWLSLLIPGLGDHRVTYGQRKGIGITVSTYLLAGAGVGCLLYNHYYPQNSLKSLLTYSMYNCFIAAGCIWLSDIIYVIAKGAQNKKAVKLYARSHVSAFYEPSSNSTGLFYSMNF